MPAEPDRRRARYRELIAGGTWDAGLEPARRAGIGTSAFLGAPLAVTQFVVRQLSGVLDLVVVTPGLVQAVSDTLAARALALVV